MYQGTSQFGAHELIGMNEALMSKSANIEVLSFLSSQVQDTKLQNMLEQHVQMIQNHYHQGVGILQGHHAGMPSIPPSYPSTMTTQPKLGLRNPSMPSPNLHAQAPSERSICTIALNMYKFGAVAWTTFALECTNPQLRTFLMNGTNMCDKMAYEMWSFMNQKGYYQVPTLQENTTQTLIQAYQTPQVSQMMHGMNPYQ
ncbi:spore coat protein [Alicyclobacillus mengziensis]|nr:spore coat protein [Alicyclobacillus mengziensis]